MLTKEDFISLSEIKTSPGVSIYQSTHVKGKSVKEGEDKTEFKNYLQEINKQLKESCWQERDINNILSPAWNLYEDGDFWTRQSQGLAVFLNNEGYLKYYKLPFSVNPGAYLQDQFYLVPLLPGISETQKYYLLTVSLKNINLFQATPFVMEKILLGSKKPSDIEEEVLSLYDFERSQQFHSGRGGGTPIYHGQGGDGEEDHKPYILEYFRHVDNVLHDALQNRPHLPLVFAGVDYLFPLFKEASSYDNIYEHPIKGNPDGLTADQLHEKSKEILAPVFEEEKENKLADYKELAGTGKTANEVSEVVIAAHDGRIDVLFLKSGNPIWGKYEGGMKRSVTLQEDKQEGDVSLSNQAALETIKNGGKAFLMDEDEFPQDPVNTGMAAILRF